MSMKAEVEPITMDELMDDVLEADAREVGKAAQDAIEFAAGYSGDMTVERRPRPRHNSFGGPPGWADKTGNLKRGFSVRVEAAVGRDDVAIVILQNTAPHASNVEARGYHILEGLDEYLDQILRERLRG